MDTWYIITVTILSILSTATACAWIRDDQGFLTVQDILLIIALAVIASFFVVIPVIYNICAFFHWVDKSQFTNHHYFVKKENK